MRQKLEPKFASVVDAANVTGLSSRTIERLGEQGLLKFYRPVDKRLVKLEELFQLIEAAGDVNPGLRGAHLRKEN